MKIAIISRSNLDDRVYWSGAINTIFNKLKSYNKIEIIKIDRLDNSFRKLFALKREYLKYTKKIKFDETYNLFVSKNYAKQIKNKLSKHKNINFVLTFDSSLVAYLKINIPIILWTDLLYSDYYDHYFKKLQVSNETKISIKKIEQNALKNCHRIFLASKWALKRAKTKYKKLYYKFRLLHIGPSFISSVTRSKIKSHISKRSKKKLYLITLSVKWKRKGLDKAIILNKILNRRGINSQLKIIGLKNKKINDKNIKIVNFINKNKTSGEKNISDYLLKSHFHILFSNYEAYGISIVEANSRGLPNLSFRVGGINHIMKNGINGKIFDKEEDLEIVANYLINIFHDYKKYKKLATTSYDYYKNNFSYNKIIPKFIKIIKK